MQLAYKVTIDMQYFHMINMYFSKVIISIQYEKCGSTR